MNINNATRRIVFLTNLNSPQIEQAIFILRDDVICEKADAVTEAQKIVDEYLSELHSPLLSMTDRKKRVRKTVSVLSFIAAAFFAVALFSYFAAM